MAQSENLEHKLILVVDDEEDVLATIKDELSDVPDLTIHAATTFEIAKGLSQNNPVSSGSLVTPATPDSSPGQAPGSRKSGFRLSQE